MSSIAIVTDTDSSLPLDVADKYGIRQVPIMIHFGDEIFRSELDITDTEVFARVDREGELPTTSAPSPGQFATAYEEALSHGADSIVCICVSSAVSGTYNAALNACSLMPDCDITVVDSQRMSMAQGFMAIAAAEAAEAGATVPEIVEVVESMRERIHLYAALSTLKYLAMSGRIGHIAAGMGTLLNIKPILTLNDKGGLDLLERVRTRKKAWNRVMELTVNAVGDSPIERLAILHVDALEDAKKFKRELEAVLPCPEDVIIAGLTAGLSVHSGAGIVGATVVTAE